MWYRLDNRELATVLAALRYWQREVVTVAGVVVEELPEGDIATNCGTLEYLGEGEIDSLCERLNTEERAPDKLLEVARGKYAYPSDDDVEIDDDAATSEADEGTWVMAWCYVRREDFEAPSSDETEEPATADYVGEFWDDFGGGFPNDTWTKPFPTQQEAQAFFRKQIDDSIETDNGIGYAHARMKRGEEIISLYTRVK